MKRILVLIAILLMNVSVILAQCPMCAMSAEQSPYKQGINTGIVYLLCFPFVLMGGILIYWRFNKDKFNSTEKNSIDISKN
ncbi:MAG: hypothetical protein K1X55_05305 [Chitinophagales bacterium]|nr:hypothetical protein [Chitinophagales bacterium]